MVVFKKCSRCGAFFNTSNDVCDCCLSKDAQDIYKLKDYMNTSGVEPTVANLATGTGISERNINRFIANKSFTPET